MGNYLPKVTPSEAAGDRRPSAADVEQAPALACGPTPSPHRGRRASNIRGRAPPNKTCFKCGQMGHRAFQCSAQIKCFKCRQPGHTQDRCKLSNNNSGKWCDFHQTNTHSNTDCKQSNNSGKWCDLHQTNTHSNTDCKQSNNSGKWCDFHKTNTHSNNECRQSNPNPEGQLWCSFHEMFGHSDLNCGAKQKTYKIGLGNQGLGRHLLPQPFKNHIYTNPPPGWPTSSWYPSREVTGNWQSASVSSQPL